MSREVSPQFDVDLPIFRTVCLPKRVMVAYFTYAPLVAFIFNLIFLPANLLLLPYYLLSILARGKPPKYLYGWVYFNSAYLYGAIHDKKEVWYDFWVIYYLYFGFIVAFIIWIFNIITVCLLFPLLFYVEEWELTAKAYYRITFGNWKRIVNECPEMRYKKEMHKRQKEEKKKQMQNQWKQAKQSGKVHEAHTVKVTDEDDDFKSKQTLACPTCGETIDKNTVYCPKCGSYVKV